MKFRVGFDFDVLEAGRVPNEDDLAGHLADVLDALLDLEDVYDPDVSATLTEGHVAISLTLEVEDELAAAQLGSAAVRSAVNAAGGYQQWGVVDLNTRMTVEKLNELSPA